MKVPYIGGAANHNGLESCAVVSLRLRFDRRMPSVGLIRLAVVGWAA
jgi:hypothetical protein